MLCFKNEGSACPLFHHKIYPDTSPKGCIYLAVKYCTDTFFFICLFWKLNAAGCGKYRLPEKEDENMFRMTFTKKNTAAGKARENTASVKACRHAGGRGTCIRLLFRDIGI